MITPTKSLILPSEGTTNKTNQITFRKKTTAGPIPLINKLILS